ncbi:MAG TPA: right-handed parallel beta-helix repeat-containing protein [Candidatus Krumholzibacteria bacterium]|nr:right-handed parallel beta-helix repeat-containing protein [Candidatus Krumholzibacteria bacterium]HPD72823.1 right-handed parallel beta-helix repeat-containing protein [Candidatus Krumholzibacteria bacterium]HRY40245.1 right-handed parallel beta-helix repeat-containing protein [Candidatus Krumholzibacteria bacterium]
MKRIIFGAFALLPMLGPGAAVADVINVPGDFAQIHAAVQAAAAGDTVQVAAGTYTDCTHETEGPGSTPACVIMRPGVTLRGAGPDATVIDAETLGRGIFVHDTDGVVIEDLQVRNAYAEIYGAGILIRQGSTGAVLRNLKIQTNGDGGIVVINNASASLTDVSFVQNAAKQGGGLAVEETSTASVTDCIFDRNVAPSGGGIFVRTGCTVDITGSTFVDNAVNADFGNGGAVCVQDSECNISGCTFTGNSTRGGGGGLAYVSTATGIVENCELVGNRTAASYNYGGGITCQQSAPIFRNLLLVGNTANTTGSDGGAIDIQFNPAPTIEHCTLVDNSCSGDGFGGGVLVQWGAKPSIANCIIASSTAGAGLACVFSDSATVTGCDIWDNAGGDAVCGLDGGCNFSADPLFCDVVGGNYRVEPASPCAAGNHPAGGGCGASYVGAYPAGCGTAVGEVPHAGIVLGNLPNPFNPHTTIFFTLDVPGDVVVRIHDVRGRTLRTFARSDVPAGVRHEFTWDGRDQAGRALSSGVYLYRLESRGVATTKRMSLIR